MFFIFTENGLYLVCLFLFASDVSPLPLLAGKCKCISFLASVFHLPLVILNQIAKLAWHSFIEKLCYLLTFGFETSL